jgi:hypothetical protein
MRPDAPDGRCRGPRVRRGVEPQRRQKLRHELRGHRAATARSGPAMPASGVPAAPAGIVPGASARASALSGKAG